MCWNKGDAEEGGNKLYAHVTLAYVSPILAVAFRKRRSGRALRGTAAGLLDIEETHVLKVDGAALTAPWQD